MKIITINNNDMGQNVYFYFDEVTKEGVIIDPGNNIKEITQTIEQENIQLIGILLTHGHFDHILYAEEVKRLTNAPIYCHESEANMLKEPQLNLSIMVKKEIGFSPDKLLGQKIFCFKVIHTPGHTSGGVCFYDEENGNLFTGDTLFKDAIGRTDLPTGDHETLLNSIKERLFTLPDNAVVYPGHGGSTTVKAEKS